MRSDAGTNFPTPYLKKGVGAPRPMRKHGRPGAVSGAEESFLTVGGIPPSPGAADWRSDEDGGSLGPRAYPGAGAPAPRLPTRRVRASKGHPLQAA